VPWSFPIRDTETARLGQLHLPGLLLLQVTSHSSFPPSDIWSVLTGCWEDSTEAATISNMR
jgi:hypothetical protein